MALLTSDIVWLVAREVVLPDGSVQRVLTPQLYALVDSSTGSLTSGLFNSGTLAARETLNMCAGNDTWSSLATPCQPGQALKAIAHAVKPRSLKACEDHSQKQSVFQGRRNHDHF
jgi:hypothetical protein